MAKQPKSDASTTAASKRKPTAAASDERKPAGNSTFADLDWPRMIDANEPTDLPAPTTPPEPIP